MAFRASRRRASPATGRLAMLPGWRQDRRHDYHAHVKSPSQAGQRPVRRKGPARGSGRRRLRGELVMRPSAFCSLPAQGQPGRQARGRAAAVLRRPSRLHLRRVCRRLGEDHGGRRRAAMSTKSAGPRPDSESQSANPGRNAPIGVFDSGVGGLSVLREIPTGAACRGSHLRGRLRICTVRRPS